MEYNEKLFLTLQCDTACFYVECPGIYGFMSEAYRHQNYAYLFTCGLFKNTPPPTNAQVKKT
jgi:hypothetical protein